jgi:long-chain acyl-CoA synthetase
MHERAEHNDAETAANIRAAQRCDDADDSARAIGWPSLGALLAARGRDDGDRPFLRYFDDDADIHETYSYAAFDQLVERIARRLVDEFGIRRGDAVATLAYNHPLAAAALFACWRIGAIAAPQNLHESDDRIAFTVNDADCRVLLALPACLARAETISVVTGRTLQVGVLNDDGVTQDTPLAIEQADFRDAPALIVYTSGTTGNPKGVLLTQGNLMLNALGTTEVHEIDSATTLMCVLPIHHVNGIVVTVVAGVLAAARLVLCRAFKASTFWPRVVEERVAIVSVVPTILQFLCGSPLRVPRSDLNNFRYVICGAGTLAVALAQKFEEAFQCPVVHGYGLSETTAFACSMPPHLTESARRHWLSAWGYPSIGVAFPHAALAIHDADGHTLAEGERGEIVIRGPYVMVGYHRRPDANAETFKHGWFRSGDEGFFRCGDDGRHFFFITGRIKELINRGGVKYSPFEIEEALLAVPGVKAALAIAFENDWYGEEVGAFVVPEEGAALTESDVLARVRTRLPFEKSPKVVKFGTDIPVTTTGKYQRLKLRALFAEHRAMQFSASRKGKD